MQITRQADYAVRAVLYLARLGPSEHAATSQVAEEQRIPPSFLAKTIARLSLAGLIHTSRGARGGVTLARDPEEITLLEVIEAIEGPMALHECLGDGGSCTFDEGCPLRPVWCEVQDEFVKRLKGTNFAQLLEQSTAAA